MCPGGFEEAQVQVIESKTSHLVASEAVSQETQSPDDRGANFHLNIYLR